MGFCTCDCDRTLIARRAMQCIIIHLKLLNFVSSLVEMFLFKVSSSPSGQNRRKSSLSAKLSKNALLLTVFFWRFCPLGLRKLFVEMFRLRKASHLKKTNFIGNHFPPRLHVKLLNINFYTKSVIPIQNRFIFSLGTYAIFVHLNIIFKSWPELIFA